MINGSSAKNDLHLAVKLLGKNDELWKDFPIAVIGCRAGYAEPSEI
jgi:hypothetical protein